MKLIRYCVPQFVGQHLIKAPQLIDAILKRNGALNIRPNKRWSCTTYSLPDSPESEETFKKIWDELKLMHPNAITYSGLPLLPFCPVHGYFEPRSPSNKRCGSYFCHVEANPGYLKPDYRSTI